ncbi:type IV pilus modification PilV family protein [Candidatus Laterigemmans baculatus]|uniref:type IV pilus modification PilV family protein n=1 Tax=Candidatus Laterigemmans baculatus TaxID=2770505 RepID=UPI0013DAB0C6|nr:hypothetical protein [Candidatus Laterigemmans baculatus]
MTRHGVTFIEVLFAIGLVLVGMVGLISVIPVASHQAQDTISLNAGAALATTAHGELQARNYLNPANWVMVGDTGGTPSVSAFPTSSAGTVSVCIDPLYMAYADNYVAEGSGGYYTPFTTVGTNGHRRFRFPYYKAEHNPLVDPSLPTSSGNAWPSSSWRMLRVSVDRVSQAGPQGISEAEALLVTQGADDLSVFQTDDKSLDVVPLFTQALPGSPATGQVTVSGRFSWMATVNPIPDTPFASVSTVIFRNRDRSFYTPPASLGPVTQARDNAAGERIAWVSAASGFQGGAGGTVTIAAARNTPSDVKVNDWVMLSRVDSGNPMHRWYRVIATIDEATEATISDPHGGASRDVWTRQLMLDGPDWTFDSAAGVADDTVMTLVDDVVAVTEHTIRITSRDR